jgi:DNA-binding transcriptional MerR regulator
MKINDDKNGPYKSISEAAKELGLINKKNGFIQTHTLRYWETQFKQIKPVIGAGKRRYYSKKVINIVKYIQFLLKDKGLTITGVKKILNNKESDSIDAHTNFGVYKSELNNTNVIKNKIKNISKIIKEIKKINNG